MQESYHFKKNKIGIWGFTRKKYQYFKLLTTHLKMCALCIYTVRLSLDIRPPTWQNHPESIDSYKDWLIQIYSLECSFLWRRHRSPFWESLKRIFTQLTPRGLNSFAFSAVGLWHFKAASQQMQSCPTLNLNQRKYLLFVRITLNTLGREHTVSLCPTV